jgi:hypothetical protein
VRAVSAERRPLSEDELLSRFENVRRSNGGWQVRCPGHDDQINSLCIHRKDGVWLLKCQAGCATRDVLAAVDIEMRELFPESGNGHDPSAELYPYLDERGQLLFQVVRLQGKRFRQRQPDPERRGEWLWNTQGVRRVLYQLPSVLAAVEVGETIYFAEGEKDVHALERAGVVATCNPGGAGKWREEYAGTLRGANVVVVTDKDEPGRKHAETVRASLVKVANSVRVVAATRGTAAADHLAAGLGVEEFAVVSSDEHRSLKIMTHDEFLDLEIKVEAALVEGLITRGSLGAIGGLPESHKSWLAQEIALRVARGEGEILGRRVLSQGRVWYVYEDDSTEDQKQRVQLFESKHRARGLPLHWSVNEGVELPRDIDLLREKIDEHRIDLLILDSFYNVTPGIDLRDNEAEEVVVRLKQDIAKRTRCSVLIVDHTPHPTEANKGRLRLYGGVFKGAAIRWGIYIDSSRPQHKLEIRGNNIPPLPKTNVRFNPDTLLLELGSTSSDTEEWKPTILMERASRYVEACADSPSKNQAIQAIHGKSTDHKRQAIDLLIRDGYFKVEPGPRNAQLLVSVKPYREGDEPADAADDIPF